MEAFAYANPATLAEAFKALGASWNDAQVLAGGTDLISLMKDYVVSPKTVVNIKNIKELGGIAPRVGIWNPPLHELPEVCRTQAQVFLRVAALAPRLSIARIDLDALPGGVTRVEIVVLGPE